MLRRFLGLLFLALIAIGGYFTYRHFEHSGPTDALRLSGNVDVRVVNLGSRVFGRIDEVYYDEGERVEKGARVAKIDDQPYQDDVDNARALLREAQISLENAQRNFERKKTLLAKKFISTQEFDDTQARRDELAARVSALQAQLVSAQTDLDDTIIYAPSSGVVLTRSREPGSIVNRGETLMSVTVDSPVWVRTYVTGADLAHVQAGQKVKVVIPEALEHTYSGHIGFISPSAEFTPKNVETREQRPDLVYRLRVIVENPDRTLKQGMPVHTYIPKRVQDTPPTPVAD